MSAEKIWSLIAVKNESNQQIEPLDDPLWPEERRDTRCTDREELYNIDQLGCQYECVSRNTCVGIEISNNSGYDDRCYICYDDDFHASDNGFGFYRRPGDLWPEEKEDACCEQRTQYTDVTNQQECQNKCTSRSDCVGICYTYKPGHTYYCDLCFNDVYINAMNDYGFYRRPDET